MASPFQKYNSENKERWTVLMDMPDWIVNDAVDVVINVVYKINGILRQTVIASIQRRYRVIIEEIFPGATEGATDFKYSLREGLRNGDFDAFLMLELIVMYIRDIAPTKVPYGSDEIEDAKLLKYLDKMLENGSKWKINMERNADSGLAERVDAELVALAQEVDEPNLTRAWNYAFQLTPEPEKAVEEAIKAIELSASESGLTNLTTGVYGGIIGDIKANPSLYVSAATQAFQKHDELNKKQNNINNVFAQWFASGMDIVQKTDPAHHNSKVVKDFVLSFDAARQAVIIATMLCWLIKKGYFTKTTK